MWLATGADTANGRTDATALPQKQESTARPQVLDALGSCLRRSTVPSHADESRLFTSGEAIAALPNRRAPAKAGAQGARETRLG